MQGSCTENLSSWLPHCLFAALVCGQGHKHHPNRLMRNWTMLEWNGVAQQLPALLWA